MTAATSNRGAGKPPRRAAGRALSALTALSALVVPSAFPPAATLATLNTFPAQIVLAAFPASVALSAALPGPAAASPGDPSLWHDERGRRYSNRKASHIGDLITVLVTESSIGTNRSTLKTKKETKFNAEGGPGTGAFGFLPDFKAKGGVKNELDGTGQTVIQGQLSTKITASVVEVRPNGHLVIEGSRLIAVNKDEDQITLHGVVRPEDIAADNTVLSTYLAEARISYNGKGPVRGAAHRGIFNRILSWIF